jgi:hypothetical protein
MDTCGSIFTQPFYSGDDIPITINFFQPDNITPKPMTGYTVGITVKEALDDGYGNPIPDAQALFSDDLPGDNTGVFKFEIPGFNVGGAVTFAPGNYFFEVKQWDQSGKRTTVVSSTLPINQSVALRAAP